MLNQLNGFEVQKRPFPFNSNQEDIYCSKFYRKWKKILSNNQEISQIKPVEETSIYCINHSKELNTKHRSVKILKLYEKENLLLRKSYFESSQRKKSYQKNQKNNEVSNQNNNLNVADIYYYDNSLLKKLYMDRTK